MPSLSLPGGQSQMLFANDVDAAYLANFTAAKGRLWGRVQRPVDDFIITRIIERLKKLSGLTVIQIERIESDAFADLLRNAVYQDLNRGLAIIAFNDAVEIKDSARCRIICDDLMTEVIRQMLLDFGQFRRDVLTSKTRACVVWIDTYVNRWIRQIDVKIERRL
ncbi:MAG: hypothetical protein H2054_02940 [Sphingomonas sp.]|uniref:hypothetical protein n=1 Tax=Sphingomonas sp. TaxID=28214 RepID=UPI0017BCC7F3|nr:hypothetical protein [Sphingomonas sp.]